MLRLTRLWIDGFHNLKDVTVEFHPGGMTTVILGQNGTGKSYLLEAIAVIFRNADLDVAPPAFHFSLSYIIGNHRVTIANPSGKWEYVVDGTGMTPRDFAAAKSDLFPDTVFAYYSGTNNRMEAHFDAHQQRYYRKLIEDVSESSFKAASIDDRRLFYARPIHGVLALMCLLTTDDAEIRELLRDMLGVTGFHSAMLLMRKPWFAKGRAGSDATQFWGASGRPGRAARLVRQQAFFPMALNQRASDDYRSKGKDESQYAIFLRNQEALKAFASNFADDLELFEEFESIDISDLYRWVQVWVKRIGSEDGDVSYGEMSEGERQLLTVLGLIRLSRSKRTLFLLDEPDTHLNPRWQYDYLELIQKWAGKSDDRCQILLTTHNPLMIGSLRKEQVRALSMRKDGGIEAREPDDDPIGIGVEGLLKSELFGLRSTLAPAVLAKIDEHYRLLGKRDRTPEEDQDVRRLAIELNSLGISQTHPNPYFEEFAKAMARTSPQPDVGLSKEQIDEQTLLADEILSELRAEELAMAQDAEVHENQRATGDTPGAGEA
jgi:predicted ATPase